ncbi:MAG: hypothetical protein AAFQ57_15370 [Cyanobacteria bacterium J06626_14]
MVQYTLAQSPGITLEVPGKDSRKARDRAMDQLIERMDEGELPTDLADGFDPQQFIEVKMPESTSDVKSREEAVVEAVQVLNHLATLKLKVQDSREDALKIRQLVDLLFIDDPITEDQMMDLKNGFKTLKNFAQINLKYRDAKSQAESARKLLDEALT